MNSFYKYENFMNLLSYWNTVAVQCGENQHTKGNRLETSPLQGQHVIAFSEKDRHTHDP